MNTIKIEHLSEPQACRHEWVAQSGFYISCCLTYEEPVFYPPSGLLQVEACPRCGSIRLPETPELKPAPPLIEAVEISGSTINITESMEPVSIPTGASPAEVKL